MERRILRIDTTGITVAQSARLDSEQRLHDAIAAHPEVLPHEDFGLGPLVSLAVELDLGSGPMDLLAADDQGRLVIVEFKRGTENPDVRQVVAQLLDYGASLWKYEYSGLEEQCLKQAFEHPETFAALAASRLEVLGHHLDEDVFQAGVEASLKSGAFAFVYCGRNLDDRTRRIMTYLAEGPRMSFFAVEVDYYTEAATDTAMLVPRSAFIPSWVAAPTAGDSRRGLDAAPPDYFELVNRMDVLAQDLGLQRSKRRSGWNYLPPTLEEGIRYASSGIGVYASSRGVELNFSPLEDVGRRDLAEELVVRLNTITGESIVLGKGWPSVPRRLLLDHWPQVRSEVIEPYFRARMTSGHTDTAG
jgi:hypothetical protein